MYIDTKFLTKVMCKFDLYDSNFNFATNNDYLLSMRFLNRIIALHYCTYPLIHFQTKLATNWIRAVYLSITATTWRYWITTIEVMITLTFYAVFLKEGTSVGTEEDWTGREQASLYKPHDENKACMNKCNLIQFSSHPLNAGPRALCRHELWHGSSSSWTVMVMVVCMCKNRYISLHFHVRGKYMICLPTKDKSNSSLYFESRSL